MSRIKSSDIKLGDSFVFGKQDSKVEKIDITDKNFLASLSDEMQAGIEKILNNAKQEASQIIENAKNEAENLKQTAHVEASEKGYNEGFEKGRQDGLNQINTELSQKIQRFEEFIKLVINSKNNIYRDAQDELLEFVVAVAEKLTCNNLKENKNLLLELIVEASSELKERENLTITVHPSMANTLYSITDELKQKILSLKNIKILEDKMLADDGLIIETGDSRIDASFKTRVEEILKTLKKEAQSTRIIPDNLEILE